MEVAILSIFTGSDEEPATMERKQIQCAAEPARQLPRAGSVAHCFCFLSFGSRFHPISTSAISQTAHANSRNPLIALPTAQDRQFSRGWLVCASMLSLCSLLTSANRCHRITINHCNIRMCSSDASDVMLPPQSVEIEPGTRAV